MPLLGGKAVPLDRFSVVLRHASAVGVPETQADLGERVPLLGGKAEPLHRFGVVLHHASARHVHGTQLGLGERVPLLGPVFKLLDIRLPNEQSHGDDRHNRSREKVLDQRPHPEGWHSRLKFTTGPRT